MRARDLGWIVVAAIFASAGCYDDTCPPGTHLLGIGCVPDRDASVVGPPAADLGLCPAGMLTGRCAIPGLVCQAPPPSRVTCTCLQATAQWSCCGGTTACGSDGGTLDAGDAGND